MANAFQNMSIIATIPYFHGRSVARQGETTAEQFMRSITQSMASIHPQPPGATKIAMVGRQLRGPALDWFQFACHPVEHAPSQYDRQRILNDFEYFTEQFKKKFYTSHDHSSISDDISDIKPLDHETPTQYLDRLSYKLRPVTSLIHTRLQDWVGGWTDAPATNNLTTVLGQLDGITAHFPNGLTMDAIRTAIFDSQVAAGRKAVSHVTFDLEMLNVGRTAAKHLKQEYARDLVRERMLEPGMTLPTLIEHVTVKERIKKAPAMTAAAFVSEVAVSDSPSDPAQQDTAEGEDGEEQNGYQGDVALMRGQRGKKKSSPQQQQQSKMAAGSPGGPPAKEHQWCYYCRIPSHVTSQCRKLQRAKKRDEENPPQPRQRGGQWKQQPKQQQQQSNPRNFAEVPREQGGYRRAPEDMEVGKTDSVGADYYSNPAHNLGDPMFKPAGNY